MTARPTTRVFVRDRDGARLFVEITWIGLEVEVVTGTVGAGGRSTAHVFTSVDERDTFIGTRIAKARHEGFVEGAADDVPTPEPVDRVDDDARRAQVLRARHEGVAYVLTVAPGDDDRRGSKIGGTPWLEPGDAWPVCDGCRQPLDFVLQLAKDDVPSEMAWAFRADLLQLFLCNSQGKAGNPDWLCQADGEGWRPFAPSTLVRHVRRGAAPEAIRTALSAFLLEQRRRRGIEAMVAYCRRSGDLGSAASWAARLTSERLDPRAWDVPDSVDDYRVRRPLLLPVRRVTAWTSEPDAPASIDLGHEDADLLEDQLQLRCRHGEKLGGFPRWAQDAQVPACRRCRAPMRHVFQIPTSGRFAINIGGDGIGWLFACADPACDDATFTWQR